MLAAIAIELDSAIGPTDDADDAVAVPCSGSMAPPPQPARTVIDANSVDNMLSLKIEGGLMRFMVLPAMSNFGTRSAKFLTIEGRVSGDAIGLVVWHQAGVMLGVSPVADGRAIKTRLRSSGPRFPARSIAFRQVRARVNLADVRKVCVQ